MTANLLMYLECDVPRCGTIVKVKAKIEVDWYGDSLEDLEDCLNIFAKPAELPSGWSNQHGGHICSGCMLQGKRL